MNTAPASRREKPTTPNDFWGDLIAPLYPYQKQVKELIQAGKSVILQAPTGAGKTRAALSPFIENFFERPAGSVPRKCIYCVPMRVLASQFVLQHRELAANYEQKSQREIRVRIQTGVQSEDKEFAGDLIFCTIDQFLSSTLMMPYSLSNRRANLNAGAGVGSYLVFDEFHLLDPDSTLPTAWYAIKQFSQVAPVLLMTATFSRSMLDALAKDLKAEVVAVSAEEARRIENRIPAAQPRQRTWFTAAEPLSPQAILAEHRRRSLVLCNTVQRAQSLHQAIKEEIQNSQLPIQLLMLHSRYLSEDRSRIEADLRRLFGKGAGSDTSGSVIAIATQTIEVGVDITSAVLHTELAPSSALIQRAGRCARYPGEQGKVIVYPVEHYAPYASDSDGKAWQEEMQAAFEWLSAHSGEVLGFTQEQELVNAVATPRDRRVVEGLLAGRASRRQDILRVLHGDWQSGDGRLLIRDANSCRILIHPQPNDLLDNPYNATGFNIQPSTLFRFLKEWQQRADQLELDWTAKVLVDPKRDRHESNNSEYRWERLDKSLIPAARMVVVNPALAGYEPDEGFLPGRGGTRFISSFAEDDVAKPAQENYSYCLESYEEHVAWVLKAFEIVVLPELVFPAQALEKAAGWRSGALLEAAWLTCLFHDAGKLSTGWQGWARAHQRAIGKPVPNEFAIAHTDTHSQPGALKTNPAATQQRNPRPNHAGEGAVAVAAMLMYTLKLPDIARAAITAITRHHTPFATEFQKHTLESQAPDHIAETLKLLPSELKDKVSLGVLQSHSRFDRSFAEAILVQPAETWAWLAYTLLVRALRRADPMGTAYGNKLSKEVFI